MGGLNMHLHAKSSVSITQLQANFIQHLMFSHSNSKFLIEIENYTLIIGAINMVSCGRMECWIIVTVWKFFESYIFWLNLRCLIFFLVNYCLNSVKMKNC